MNKLQIITIFLGLSLLTFNLVSCSSASSGESANQPQESHTESEDELLGQSIYQTNCKICHGTRGNKKFGGASDLSISTLTRDEQIAVIMDGRGTMTPFKDVLSKKEITSVAEYLVELKK